MNGFRLFGNKLQQVGEALHERPHLGARDEPGFTPKQRARMVLIASLIGILAAIALIAAGLLRSSDELVTSGVGLLTLVIGYWLA